MLDAQGSCSRRGWDCFRTQLHFSSSISAEETDEAQGEGQAKSQHLQAEMAQFMYPASAACLPELQVGSGFYPGIHWSSTLAGDPDPMLPGNLLRDWRETHYPGPFYHPRSLPSMHSIKARD